MISHPLKLIIILLFGFSLIGIQAQNDRTPHAVPNIAQSVPAITYIANEGFLLEHGKKKVLVDALFSAGFDSYLTPSPKLLEQMAGSKAPFADVDLLLISHTHGDHFDPRLTAAYLRNTPRCRLVAHTQTVDQLRKEKDYTQIKDRIHEIKLEPGSSEHLNLNDIEIQVLALPHGPYFQEGRDVHAQTRNLAFFVNLAGTRFLHLGDAAIENSLTTLKAYPFDKSPVDVLCVGYDDRSLATQQFIAQTIKPNWIIAMHLPPRDLAAETEKILTAYPHAIVFKESMERRTLPMEADFHHLSGPYLGQTPPGATPLVFARGIVSMYTNEHSAPSFSPQGDEVFWWANRWPEEGPFLSMTMRQKNGYWSAPQVTPLSAMATFSPDGRRVYFFADRTRSAATPELQLSLDIWYVEKKGQDCSEPKCLDLVARYPELRKAAMPTLTRSGTLYYLGHCPGSRNDQGIYRSEFINGEYARPELLPRSINLPGFHNWTPFIAPDESYLLFSSTRPGGLDEWGDLYVSQRLTDGTWTDPVSLGEPVNTPWQECFPGLSPDGKYLFFCRDTRDEKNEVYWVDASSIQALQSSANPVKNKLFADCLVHQPIPYRQVPFRMINDCNR